MGLAEKKIMHAGYKNKKRNLWIKGGFRIQVVHSVEYYKDSIRVTWKEEWKSYHAIIYDYSSANGPICIVPVTTLFNSNFVSKKRGEKSYANSGYWWTQRFPIFHELAKLVLSNADKWELV